MAGARSIGLPEGKLPAWRGVAAVLLGLCCSMAHAQPYRDRFVWVFGWRLNQDSDVAEIRQVLETAAAHGINGAVISAGMDSLSRGNAAYFKRLDEIARACEQLKIELIPAGFSIGYGGPWTSFNKMLAEGLSVEDAPYVVSGATAKFVPDPSVQVVNGDFEIASNNRFKSFNFHDMPGKISFVDTAVKHGGASSIRLENFTADEHGHGRVMQEIKVRPHRCYRVSLWVKTENLAPAGTFQMTAIANKRYIAPKEFRLAPTSDWQKITMLVNSMEYDSFKLYAGVWGGKEGKLWLDDWTIEEVGPINVLRRPGTPVTVRSNDGQSTYVEGTDYAPLEDKNFSFTRVDHPWPDLKLLPVGKFRDGKPLKVSYYHAMAINASQVSVCMAEPEVYEIFDREVGLLAQRLHPKRLLLNMDEIRMGGTCGACRGRDIGQLLGQSITKMREIIRKHLPEAQVYIWSDMFDPNHNAHDNYYLVQGSFAGSWKHLPKDMIVAVWGGPAREKSLKFFADEGFKTLAACYYDAPNLDSVKDWLRVARPMSNVTGFMYTPWRKSYQLLGDFGDLLREQK